MLESPGTRWNNLELAGSTQNELEPSQTSWSYLERAGGTSWNHLEEGETTCNEMDLATNYHKKNKKLIGETQRTITIVQQKTILAIAIFTKSTILDVCRWNYLERNGTNNQRRQKKTLIGQYCVYNIITSLQNITLQIPNATKSSIFDVGIVSQIRLWFIIITLYMQPNVQRVSY